MNKSTVQVIAEAILELSRTMSHLTVISDYAIAQTVRKTIPDLTDTRLNTVVRTFDEWGCLEYVPHKDPRKKSTFYIADVNKSCLELFVGNSK